MKEVKNIQISNVIIALDFSIKELQKGTFLFAKILLINVYINIILAKPINKTLKNIEISKEKDK